MGGSHGYNVRAGPEPVNMPVGEAWWGIAPWSFQWEIGSRRTLSAFFSSSYYLSGSNRPSKEA